MFKIIGWILLIFAVVVFFFGRGGDNEVKTYEKSANEIRYEPGMNTVVISGNALLRQEGSEVSGSKITYNFETEYVNAESLENAKVETVLQPKAKAELTKKSKDKPE